MPGIRFIAIGAVSATLLSGCEEPEILLQGPREPIRAEAQEPLTTENVSRAFQAGPTVANASWTHVNGAPDHSIAHPALGRQLSLAWSTNIGQGNSKRHRLTADPVVAGGRVFTLDSRAQVSAFSTSGAPVWQSDLTPSADNPEDASGGGLAYADGRLYVTSGFGTLTVLNADTGATVWTQDLDAAATAPPTVADGVAYVSTRNAIGWALDTGTGRILWQVFGAPGESGLVGGPAPTIAGPLVIFAFSSGQLISAERGSGRRSWAGSVAGQRPNRVFSAISDIAGAPVVDGGRVFAANHSGRTTAFDAANGAQAWTANEGALNALWRAGDSLFLVSDENRLIRLDAGSGETVWSVALPFFEQERQSRRQATFVHYGPVLAGGRLLVASSDGLLRSFDPVNGNLLASVDLPQGAARNPVVAGNTLYVVTEGGQLLAFR